MFSLPILGYNVTGDKMDKENELPKRKKLRLKYYDYSSTGAYFITVCTQNRQQILSKIVGTGVPDCPQTNDKKTVGTGLLQFGHVRDLTPHRGVIQDPRAASLRPDCPQAEETKSEEKKIYGREQNILLTEGEYCALKGELGDRLEKRIEDVSLYIKKFGKKYESHYALILSWRDLDNGQAGRNNVAINGDYSDIAFLANSDMQLSAEQGGGFVRKMKNAGVKK